MKKIIKSAIEYKKITLFILALLLLFGAYNYYFIPRQEFPEINPPVALITVQYPGASPTDINSNITTKIEDEVSELEGFDYSNSTCRDSVSVTVVRLDVNADVDKNWNDLRQRMDDIQSDLPEQSKDIEINTDVADTASMIISLSGKSYSYEQLVKYAERLEYDLRQIDGVSKIDIIGEQEKEVKIEVDYRKLNEYNLSLNDIKELIHSQNVEIPSGQIEGERSSIIVKTDGKFKTIDEIKNLTIAVSKDNGSIARLGDIAEVYYGLEESTNKIKFNGKNSVLLVGYIKGDVNAVLVGEEAKEVINTFEQELPKDLEFSNVSFQPENIDQSIDDFNDNLVQGVIFVIIIVFIGMGVRNALIVSTAIPSAIIITFNAMGLLGIKLHQVSIAALIVALGMLVDNAIVVSDAIQVKFDEGVDRLQACIEGTSEVAIPVLTSTLTTVSAFLPFLLMTSIAGEYIQSLPSIIMISLAISYLIALMITPTMAFLFFKKRTQKIKQSRIRLFFKRLLINGLNHRKTVAFLVLFVIGVTIWVGLNLGLQFFPYADTDLIYIEITNEIKGNFESTEELTFEAENLLKSDPYVMNYTSSIGDDLPKFYNTMPFHSPSDDFAQIVVEVDLNKIKSSESEYLNLSYYVEDLQRRFDQTMTGGEIIVNQIEQGEPIGHPVRIRVSGESIKEILTVKEIVKDQLDEIPGTSNVGDDFANKKYKYHVKINDDKLNMLGVSKYDIQNEISIALRGRVASLLKKNGEEFDILVESNINSKSDLENLKIKSSMTGKKYLLKSLGEVDLIAEYPVMKKYNGQQSILVYSDVKPGYSSVAIQESLENEFDSIVTDTVNLAFDGEREKIIQNFGDMTLLALLAIALVFIILLFQFKSYKRTLIILFTIPLSIVGSIFGLYIAGQNLSFLAMLGIVSLLGIVVNNAIVLVDFIDAEIEQNKTTYTACVDAVEKRFRPIILTTATTVIGLTPLIYTRSVMFMPLAIALMSGLLVSTLLTLVIIPVVYYAIIRKDYEDRNINQLKNQLDTLK